MRIAVFDTHKFEKPIFDELNKEFKQEIIFFDSRLTEETASIVRGFSVVCVFVNDCLNKNVIRILANAGVKLIALRSAGYNHVDLSAAREFGLKVVRVPAYSPHAVAEHSIALLLALNRKLCKASVRVREMNFSLDGLVGFDLYKKTVGLIGVGKIGSVVARILHGFGCNILAYDKRIDSHLESAFNVKYVSLEELLTHSDIISLHLPLNVETKHIIAHEQISKMKDGVIIINTGRGALIDTKALIVGLKSGKIGSAGLDVYEEEENLFFQDLSDTILQDDILARLMTFPNVLITAHQAFLTREALQNIVETTLENIVAFESGNELKNEISPQEK